MGRTNLILLGMGLLACVVLSLLMRRGLNIQQSGRTDPVVKAVNEVFGWRLREPPRFQIQSRGDQKVGILVLIPRVSRNVSRLAQNVGTLVGQEDANRFDSLEIVCKQNELDKGRRIPIPSPFLGRRSAFRATRKTPRPAPKPGKPGPKPNR